MAACNTRFIFTPTGPAHIGHCFTARANWLIAWRTGGTWHCRIEDVLAMQSHYSLRTTPAPGNEVEARRWGRQNLDDLNWCGLTDLGIPAIYQSEHKQLVDWYYRLLGDEEYFGAWPAEGGEGLISNRDAIYLGSEGLFTAHPYVVLSRVVSDIKTGCTLVLRGSGLRYESGLYHYFAEKICRRQPSLQIPKLAYLPDIVCEGNVALSSSLPSSEGWRIEDVRKAGRTPAELHSFLDWATMTEEGREETAQSYRSGKCPPCEAVNSDTRIAADATGLLALLKDKEQIVIPDDNWFRFLETGQVPE